MKIMKGNGSFEMQISLRASGHGGKLPNPWGKVLIPAMT